MIEVIPEYKILITNIMICFKLSLVQ